MGGALWSDEQEKPIQHLRVIDMSIMLPGPYLTRLMAQYGADVIKVEALPNGDPIRALKDTSIFELMNQGKRSIGVNLKTDEGIELVRRMAGESDLFVEGFREGVMDQMGLGYSDLSEENPDLLYVSLRGFAGKNAPKPGHDLNYLATSGCGEWFLESGVPNYSTQFGDIAGGMLVPAIKVLLHLANPARRGMHLISSMEESLRALYMPRAYDLFKAESAPEAERAKFGLHKTTDGTKAHSRYYKCRDGHWITLNAVQSKHWQLFCEVVDRPQWKDRSDDPLLVAELEKLFQDAPSTYWEALTAERELCLFRVIPWAEHFSFSQARSQFAGDPLTWAGFAPNPNLKPAPTLGRDTFEVVHGLGVSNKEISDWMQAGFIK